MADPVDTRAPLKSRVYAGLIDTVIFSMLYVSIAATGHRWAESGTTRLILIELTVGFWFVLTSWWTTPGSWLYGLRLVDDLGLPPSLRQILTRSLVPGTVWVAVFAILRFRTDLPVDQQFAFRAMTGYIALSPILWICTTKLRNDGWTAYNDRWSGTSVTQGHTNLWIFPRARFLIDSALQRVESEVKAGLVALGERILYAVAWLIEATEPLRFDVRRTVALLVDLGLLVLAYLIVRDKQGLFAQADSWYFLIVTLAVVLFVVMPARGYSPGKKLLGLRIVDRHAQAPGYRLALSRALIPGTLWVVLLLVAPQWALAPSTGGPKGWLTLILIVSIVFALLDVMIYFGHPAYDALHDQATNSRVVRHRPTNLTIIRIEPSAPAIRRPGRWPRFLGLLIDLALVVLCFRWNSALFPGLDSIDARTAGEMLILIGFFVGLVALGTTPGSWVTGTRIVARARDTAPGLGRAAMRALPYAPLLVLMAEEFSPLAFQFEANQRVKAVSDLFLLALLLAMAIDLLAFLRGREPMHDRIAGTTVTGCKADSLRGRFGAWVSDRWRWLTGAEPSPSPKVQPEIR